LIDGEVIGIKVILCGLLLVFNLLPGELAQLEVKPKFSRAFLDFFPGVHKQVSGIYKLFSRQ
jgi:hypothetical protein